MEHPALETAPLRQATLEGRVRRLLGHHDHGQRHGTDLRGHRNSLLHKLFRGEDSCHQTWFWKQWLMEGEVVHWGWGGGGMIHCVYTCSGREAFGVLFHERGWDRWIVASQTIWRRLPTLCSCMQLHETPFITCANLEQTRPIFLGAVNLYLWTPLRPLAMCSFSHFDFRGRHPSITAFKVVVFELTKSDMELKSKEELCRVVSAYRWAGYNVRGSDRQERDGTCTPIYFFPTASTYAIFFSHYGAPFLHRMASAAQTSDGKGIF